MTFLSKLSSRATGVVAVVQAPMVAVGEGDPGVVVATLRQALEALSRLSNERASLEEALKVPCSSARATLMHT